MAAGPALLSPEVGRGLHRVGWTSANPCPARGLTEAKAFLEVCLHDEQITGTVGVK
jgi:hypothetical protein